MRAELKQLHERRAEIRKAIASIETMKSGTLGEFYYEQKRKDGTVAKRGPFYNITKKGKGGKTVTKSVPKQEVEATRREIENHRRFRELADEYAEVCENILMFAQDDEECKKN
jgi:hypothetical protein